MKPFIIVIMFNIIRIVLSLCVCWPIANRHQLAAQLKLMRQTAENGNIKTQKSRKRKIFFIVFNKATRKKGHIDMYGIHEMNGNATQNGME